MPIINVEKLRSSAGVKKLIVEKSITINSDKEREFQKLRFIYDKINIPILLININLKSIDDINQAFIDVLHSEKTELIGLQPSEILDEDIYKEMLDAQIPESGCFSFEKNSYLKTPNKNRIPVKLMTHITKNQNQRYAAVFVEDISNQIRLSEQIKKLSRAVEQSPVIVLITDVNGSIEYVNEKFKIETGYTEEDVIGKNPKLLQSGQTPGPVYSDLWKTITKGNIWKGEFLNKKKNGELFWEQSIISPLQNEFGAVTHYIAFKENITLKKEMEEKLKGAKLKLDGLNKLKSEFLAQISHEIRTPINTLQNFTGLLKESLAENLPDDLKEYFTYIDTAGDRIIRTMDLILNMSQLQTNTYDCKYKYVNLYDDIIIPIVDNFSARSIEKGNKIVTRNTTDTSRILADEYTLNQIVENLLDNAVKYTTGGNIVLSITDDDESNLLFKISDSGVGISNEYLPNLFKPFSQEEQGYTRKYDGNGLGLALVKEYCEINNARISIKSTKGHGTSVKIVFKKA